MHRKTLSPHYFVLGCVLFCWISLSGRVVDEMRYFATASLSPAWGWARNVKGYLSDRPGKFWEEKKEADIARLSQLELENQLLRTQIEKLLKILAADDRIVNQLDVLKNLEQKKETAIKGDPRKFFERRSMHLRSIVQLELMAMPAQTVYRTPSSWSSSLWINVGEEDNRVLGRTVIAKNSPVVSGAALVGVIDYVGKKQARVRLITDSGLSPAVRCVRESSQNGASEYLAKGELHGSGAPLWRSRSLSLQGIGFNFDCPDEEGSKQKEVPILREGDLLVTTGLDGVFPPDLMVGRVSKVYPMQVGGCAYEIEARPAATNLNDLDTLFVLPPRSD